MSENPDNEKTALESISECVAKEMMGDRQDEFGIDWDNLLELVALIMSSIVDNCPANDVKLAKAIGKPNLLQRIGFRRRVVRLCEGCGHQRWEGEWGAVSAAVISEVAKLDDSQRLDIIQEIRSNEWLVV